MAPCFDADKAACFDPCASRGDASSRGMGGRHNAAPHKVRPYGASYGAVYVARCRSSIYGEVLILHLWRDAGRVGTRGGSARSTGGSDEGRRSTARCAAVSEMRRRSAPGPSPWRCRPCCGSKDSGKFRPCPLVFRGGRNRGQARLDWVWSARTPSCPGRSPQRESRRAYHTRVGQAGHTGPHSGWATRVARGIWCGLVCAGGADGRRSRGADLLAAGRAA